MPPRRSLVAVLSLLAVLPACRSSMPRAGGDGYEDLGPLHRAISTRSSEAQKWFDRGLAQGFGFNHAEAIACFRRALEHDPECAMAYWGIAFASGPHINNPGMDESASREAIQATREAVSLLAHATPVERDLIRALEKRYAWPPPADRKPLDASFAEAMREVRRAHPEDADVAALFAESLMDLRPWDLWTAEGKPQPETPEILETLEAALALDPNHPLGLHLTIHALEASPNPERALPAADRLRHRLPGVGHLVHMPSHIDVLVGRYDEAVAANRRAVAADERFVARAGRGGFFTLYRAHNYHMLVYAAMFAGRSAEALAAARRLVEEIPEKDVEAIPDFLEAFLPTPLHVLVRFGRWEEILKEPPPPPGRPVVVAFRAYARALALSTLGRVEAARAEFREFERASEAVPESRTHGNNSVRDLLAIARPMLEGEIEYRAGRHDRAFELLRDAVARDDALRYDEPWGWMQPARHSLGALLLEQGRHEEAEKVYRADLARHPENGWSLHGLAECLRALGRAPEAADVEARLAKAWANADVEIYASCFCRQRA